MQKYKDNCFKSKFATTNIKGKCIIFNEFRDLRMNKVSLNLDDYMFINDFKNRILCINDYITNDVIDFICMNIIRINQEDKDTPIEERQPIIIYLNTGGGSVTAGFSIIDIMLSSKTPIYTVNLGMCYSMGFHIFIAGKKRFTLENSTFLLHDGSNGVIDSASKLRDYVEFTEKQMREKIKFHVLTHTDITEELYKEKYRVEWYMYPEEAKKYGICTDIIGEDCDLDFII